MDSEFEYIMALANEGKYAEARKAYAAVPAITPYGSIHITELSISTRIWLHTKVLTTVNAVRFS